MSKKNKSKNSQKLNSKSKVDVSLEVKSMDSKINEEMDELIKDAETLQDTSVEDAIEKEISMAEEEKPDNIIDIKAAKKEKDAVDEKDGVTDSEEIEIEFIDLEKKKKKHKITALDIVRYAVMLVALCVFSYAAYELTLIRINAQETKDASKKESNILKVDIDDSIEYYNVNGDKIILNNSGDGKAFVWDFEKIKAYNHNAKGYIRQGNGTYIDNPVVQHPSNNEYYLNHYSNDYPNGIGSIFIDYRIKEGLNAKNCILYGHNVKAWANHIMFGSLNFYYDNPQYGKDNPTMDIYVDEHHYVYYVYAIYKATASGDSVYTWEFESDDAFMNYVNDNKARTQYPFPDAPEITPSSNILTLSTCTTDHDYRMIVQLVRGEEIFDVPVKNNAE